MKRFKKGFKKIKRLLRKIKKLFKKIKKLIKNIKYCFSNNLSRITCLFCSIFAIILICISFYTDDELSNVFSGIGTGLLTSLLVSLLINNANNVREERNRQKQKKIILNNIVTESENLYLNIIYKINEYIIFSNIDINGIYGLYDDFKKYNEFEKNHLNNNKHDLTEKEQDDLNKLFNINVNDLVTELKQLKKQDYFLRGLLTKEEYCNLITNIEIDEYLKYVKDIDDFWKNKIINYGKCVNFLNMTIYICSNIIRVIGDSKFYVNEAEKHINDKLNEKYYLQSEEYNKKCEEESEEWSEYYSKHAEELKIETQEDKLIKQLRCCICGISRYSLNDLLKCVDNKNYKILKLILQDDVQKSLKNDWKKRRIIKNKFGTKKQINERLKHMEGNY